MKTGYLIAGSLVAHLGGFALISRKAHEIEQKQTLIQVVEQPKKEEEKKAEEPKPIEAPAAVLAPAKAAEPAAAEAPAEPAVNEQPSAAMQAMPDYGLKLENAGSGRGGGEGGTGTGGGTGDAGAPSAAPSRPVEKTLAPPAPAGALPDLAAEIAAWRPKPTARVKPVYPDEARSAEIEGTVTVEAVIHCDGKVKSASLVKGLGHGLDDAALTAARKTEFEPAPRCVPGFQKPMKINYAFRLGD